MSHLQAPFFRDNWKLKIVFEFELIILNMMQKNELYQKYKSGTFLSVV